MGISLAPGGAGELRLPGQLARGADPVDRGADLHPVDLHRPGPAGLLAQPADPAGPGAGHRPGGRRRHRRGREHPAPDRRGRAADRRRRARRAAGVLRRGRHHHRADLGVRAADVPARLHRPAVRRAGGGDRRGRGLLGPPGAQPVADAGLQAAAAGARRGLAGPPGRHAAWTRLRNSYARLAATRCWAAASAAIGVVGCWCWSWPRRAGGLFIALPKELVPNEDRGRVDIAHPGAGGRGLRLHRCKAAQAGRADPASSCQTTATADRYIVSAARLRRQPVQLRQRPTCRHERLDQAQR